MRGAGGGDPENEHQGVETELDEDPPREQLEEAEGAGGEEEIGEGEEGEDGLGLGVSSRYITMMRKLREEGTTQWHQEREERKESGEDGGKGKREAYAGKVPRHFTGDAAS